MAFSFSLSQVVGDVQLLGRAVQAMRVTRSVIIQQDGIVHRREAGKSMDPFYGACQAV
jgi:hypothetical protein